MAEPGYYRGWRQRFLPRGLFGRALLILIVPLLLLQAVVTFVFIQRHVDGITRQMTENVALELRGFANLVAAEPDLGAIDRMLARLSAGVGYPLSFVADARISPHPDLPFYRLADRAIVDTVREQFDQPVGIDTESHRKRITVSIELPRGVLQAQPPTRQMTASKPHLLLVWMMVTALVLLLVAVLFLRNQIRPIRQLAAAAEAFGKGLPTPGFKPAGAEEVRRAAGAFLTMRGRIERQIAQRTQMLSGVSHDLRTPLTRMRLALEMMDDAPEAAGLRQDVAQMQRMVDGFLAFARGEETELPEDVEVEDLLRDAVADARSGGARVAVSVDLSEPGLTMRWRRDALRRALVNLIENAGKFGTQVQVSLGSDARRVQFVIEDDGPGIPEAQRRDVFRAFWRGDAARNQDGIGGSGLGLAIALDAARAHGGDIHLGDSGLGGLRASLVLPR